MTQMACDSVTEPEAHIGETLAPVASWGDGSAPSLPSVDNEGHFDDADSAVGGLSGVTTTVSLRSSIYDHVEEDGRTYHRYREGKYPLPNDEEEQERLDLQHTLFRVTLVGKLHLAPIGPECHHVLDIATGTGIWAIEFAQQYTSSQVVGTDLSAIQPLYVPTNCRFEIDDAEDEWNFSDRFDYIHGRALLSCFKDPASVLREAFKSLNPGGYLELQDGTFPFKYIGEPPVNSDLYKWSEIVVAGAAKAGRPWTNAQHYKQWMEEIGFEDVVEKKFFWPTNSWPKGAYFKQVAAYWQADLLKGLEGISLKVMKVLGWSAEEIHAFLPAVKRDVKDTSIHAYLPINVVYGRKPMSVS
ncbi:S-adenosyl-L-methionine-dependent methyltransferase [Stipitochalara longipes BDJ]|nr:S-adenosyl-L-methionine-dependent methyltransferase [Stipitochalara longipes BDJ]